MGFDFLRATPQERVMMILIMGGLLIVAGIMAYFENRKNKK